MGDKDLLPFNKYQVGSHGVRKITHNLLELYRFLDHHCVKGESAVDINLWYTFLHWNGSAF